jgi:hypothetical protein
MLGAAAACGAAQYAVEWARSTDAGERAVWLAAVERAVRLAEIKDHNQAVEIVNTYAEAVKRGRSGG